MLSLERKPADEKPPPNVRFRALGLDLKAFALTAGVHWQTLRRYFEASGDGRSGYSKRTEIKIKNALITYERRLLDHLIRLHPDYAAQILERPEGRDAHRF